MRVPVPWRVGPRRMVADGLVVAAAWLMIAAALTLLAAGVIHADAVSSSGLRRALADADPRSVSVDVSARTDTVEVGALDAIVRRELAPLARGSSAEVALIARSESYGLPGEPTDGAVPLTIFASAEGVERHATLASGAWPVAGADPVEAAVPTQAASTLGLAVGSTLEVASRRDPDRIVPVRIVGTYQVTDPADPYWWEDPLLVTGAAESGSFRTFGPLLVTRDDLLARAAGSAVDLSWRLLPDVASIDPGEVAALRSVAGSLERRLDASVGEDQRVIVESQLPGVLAAASSSLLVSGTGVLLLIIQLAVLAGYALILVAGLLVDQRREGAALLRSRGASTLQLAAVTLVEAAIIVVPSALLAPFLALLVVEALGGTGPLAAAGVILRPRITDDAVLLVAGASLVGMGMLALPTLLSGGGPLASVRRAVGRQLDRTAAHRLGLDVALVVLAAIGLWQLQQVGGPLSRSLRGSVGADPLLVAAPAVGLVAGGVLALRIVPLVARGLEDLFGRRRALVPALGARQLARRPLRYTRSALLLILAGAIGWFAGAYAGTWERSQVDQVDYAAGADVRATVPDRPQLQASAVSGMVAGLPGASGLMPVLRVPVELGRSGAEGQLLGIVPERAADVVTLRPDLVDGSEERLLTVLAAERAVLPPLPDGARRMGVDVAASLAAVPSADRPAPLPSGYIGLSASVVVRDGFGLLHRFTSREAAYLSEGQRLDVPLGPMDASGEVLPPAPPLSLAAVELDVRLPAGTAAAGSVELQDVAWSASADAADWQPLEADRAEWTWALNDATPGAEVVPEPRGSGAAVTIDGAAPVLGPGPYRFALRAPGLAPDAGPGPAPAAFSPAFRDVTGVASGDPVEVGQRFGGRSRLFAAAEVRGFPTLDPSRPLVVADLPTLAAAEYAERGELLSPDEWWLEVPDDAATGLAQRLAEPPLELTDVAVRSTAVGDRLADPIALGVIGALGLGSLAAALFAVSGFVVSAAVGARERLTEFALLRALGLSGRELSLWLSLESAFLLLISLVAGVGLGLVLSWVVLPSVTLAPNGAAVVPPVQVAMPWEVLGMLLVLGVAAMVLTVLVIGRVIRRSGVATAMRGQD